MKRLSKKGKRVFGTGFVAACLFFTPSIGAEGGQTHQVEWGETLWSISQEYQVDMLTLAEENGRSLEEVLPTGEVLVIPGGEGSPAAVPLEDWQYQTLLAVVEQEAGPGKYESALWVMNTIQNRVEADSYFGNTIWEVITMPGQFESYQAGHYERYLGGVSPETKAAVDAVLVGHQRVHPYLYFWSEDYASRMGQDGSNVGGNVYY